MRAVIFEQFGDPAEVLQVREVPEPEPGPGQVLVRMLASPIGPADLLTIRGEYGHRLKLPATPGTEGVGIVEAGRAAGSALGRMVIRLGRHFGFRTINVVRGRQQAQELLRAGGRRSYCH